MKNEIAEIIKNLNDEKDMNERLIDLINSGKVISVTILDKDFNHNNLVVRFELKEIV